MPSPPVNPVIDIQTWLSHSISSQNYGYYEDPKADEIYDKMLHETDVAKQRALAYQFDKRVLGEEVHYLFNRIGGTAWCRCALTCMAGRSARRYANQDLSTIWLAPPKCDECSATGPNGERRAEATAK